MSVVKAREITSEEEIQRIYNWMDDLRLSRPRRNISRDFSDGVLVAEVLHQYFPRLVELHNYSAANSSAQKLYNWSTLNKKVLKRIGFQFHPADVDDLINAVPGAVEKVLCLLQHYMAKYKKQQDETRHQAAEYSAAVGGGTPSHAAANTSQGPGNPAAEQSFGSEQNYSNVNNESGPSKGGGAGGGLNDEKDLTIQELRETVLIMSEKIKKLEQLLRIKDSKIETLQGKLRAYAGE